MTNIKPFRIDIPRADLDDLADRLARTRFTEELPGYGVPVSRVRELVEYWRGSFDWRTLEARLNSYPQFTTEIDGQNVHFLHVRSSAPDAFPLILTHGWPGSIVEFLDVIEPLTEVGYDLVIPSIPGFGFSGPTTESGANRYRIATAWAELMARLGYERYGRWRLDDLARGRPDRAGARGRRARHTALLVPRGDPAEMAGLSEDEAAALAHLQWFWATIGAFNTLQSQQPQTIAHALADSPAGLAGWNGQLMLDQETDFTVAHLAIYWLTGTAASAMRLYYEDGKAHPPTEPTTVPLGLAGFANDFQSIRRFADRDHKNIVSWHTYDTGGHYAAHQATDILVADLTAFFAPFR